MIAKDQNRGVLSVNSEGKAGIRGMDVALAIFTYNRPFHLHKVLEALKENIRLQNVYIFQDGLADESAKEDRNKVHEIINAVNFKQIGITLGIRNGSKNIYGK